MAVVDTELREAMKKRGFVEELTRYAWLRHSFRGQGETSYSPDDFVQDAVESAWNGNRKWNREKYSTALDFMKGAVDSVASNTINKRENRQSAEARSLSSEYDHPILQAGISEQQAEILYDALLEAIDYDDKLFAVLEGRLDGKKRSEIAEEWGMSVEEVTNITKRLKRLIREKVDWESLKESGDHG